MSGSESLPLRRGFKRGGSHFYCGIPKGVQQRPLAEYAPARVKEKGILFYKILSGRGVPPRLKPPGDVIGVWGGAPRLNPL